MAVGGAGNAGGSGGTPPPVTGSDNAFTRMFIRLGLATSEDFEATLNRPLTAMEARIKAFNDSTQFKDSFFAKLPGLGELFGKVIPDVSRGTAAMILFGQASKYGAEDGGEFYNNLSLIGKVLVTITPHFNEAAAGASALQNGLAKFANTAGIITSGLLVAAISGIVFAFKFAIGAAIAYQDELNKFNILMGGLSRDRIHQFNMELNDTIKATTYLGLGLSNLFSIVTGFIKGGLNPHIALQKELVDITGKLSIVSGESAEAMSGFFAKLMVGSKITAENLHALGNSFVNINRMAEESGVLASVSFGDVKEAISSVGTALLIASNKGGTFTDKMTKDLVSLTTLSKTLGVSVAELNGKFEEAGNLLNSPDSGFRAILAISGGANVSQMLSNTFDKTEAMLKIAGTLEKLNAGLGGNLNLMGQIAQQAFGISKEAAIKYATMTQEQKQAIMDAQKDAEKMRTDGITDAYNSVTGTLSATWDKFKNVMMMSFQRAFAGNSGIQDFLGKMTDKLNSWVAGFGDPNSPAQQFIDRLSDTFAKISDGLSWLFDNLVPIMNKIGNWLNEIIDTTKNKNVMSAISSAFGKILMDGLVFALKSTLGSSIFWGTIIGTIAGGIIGAVFGGGVGVVPGATLGGKLGAWIGGGVGVARMSNQSSTEEEQSPNASSVANMMGPVTKTLVEQANRELEANRREQNRYRGIKDTDAIIGSDGKITLAGLEKIKLQEKEEKLIDIQELARKTTENNTSAIEKLTTAIESLDMSPEKKDEFRKNLGALNAPKTRTLQNNIDYSGSGAERSDPNYAGMM